jgi:hypothetical protein
MQGLDFVTVDWVDWFCFQTFIVNLSVKNAVIRRGSMFLLFIRLDFA